MSVQSEITRLENAKAAIKSAIEGKGVTVPEATLLDGMAALIESIEAGGGAKIYKEKVTFSSDTKNYTIEHNLGVIPNFCIFSVLDQFEHLGTQESVSMFCGILDGSMIYTAVGTGNLGASTKAYAYVPSLSYTDKTYEHLEPILGKALVVPYTISESSIRIKGEAFCMPAGTYFIMCGII